MDEFVLTRAVALDPERIGLFARPVSDLFKGRHFGRDLGVGVPEPPAAPPAVPLVTGDAIVAGQQYPSTPDGTTFALPGYAFEVVDGRHQSSLRWRGPADDPNGPLAFLVLKFTLTQPPGTVEIPHQFTATLKARVGVQGRADAGTDLALPLGAVVRTSPGTAEIRTPLLQKADFDALWLALTDPAAPATLQLAGTVHAARARLRLVVPPWRDLPVLQLPPREPPVADPPGGVRVDPRVAPDRVVDPLGAAGPLRRAGRVRPAVADALADAAARGPLADALHAHVARRELADAVAEPLSPAVLAALPAAADAPFARRATRVDLGDLVRRLPVVDPTEPPVRELGPIRTIVFVDVAASETVGPFSFPPDTNASMFDIPGDLRPGGNRVLIRHEFDPGGGSPRLVYYEDSAYPARFYYEPQQFRVPRDPADPHLPLLAVSFSGVTASDADVRFSARVHYTSVPDLDDVVLNGLRRQLAGQVGGVPDLSALLPESATLRLQVPRDAAGGALAEVAHVLPPGAFDDGFTDQVDLSPTELAAFVALLQTDAIRGVVEAELVSSGRTQIPVVLSLRDTPGIRLGRAYRGPVGAGLVRVSVRNPLESAVEIAELYATVAPGGVQAYPQADIGLRVEPGASADLDYRLQPADAVVDDLDPALKLRVDADLATLLPRLMLNEGFADQTFTLAVRTDPGYFAGAGPEALTGLGVEFDDDAAVVLTAATPAKDVAVRLPILPWLLKAPDAQRYRYRVVPITGTGDGAAPGAPGPWVDGQGAGDLLVAPAGG